jgi:hypothetical protein
MMSSVVHVSGHFNGATEIDSDQQVALEYFFGRVPGERDCERAEIDQPKAMLTMFVQWGDSPTPGRHSFDISSASSPVATYLTAAFLDH